MCFMYFLGFGLISLFCVCDCVCLLSEIYDGICVLIEDIGTGLLHNPAHERADAQACRRVALEPGQHRGAADVGDELCSQRLPDSRSLNIVLERVDHVADIAPRLLSHRLQRLLQLLGLLPRRWQWQWQSQHHQHAVARLLELRELSRVLLELVALEANDISKARVGLAERGSMRADVVHQRSRNSGPRCTVALNRINQVELVADVDDVTALLLRRKGSPLNGSHLGGEAGRTTGHSHRHLRGSSYSITL
jgi:hypothetical protein